MLSVQSKACFSGVHSIAEGDKDYILSSYTVVIYHHFLPLRRFVSHKFPPEKLERRVQSMACATVMNPKSYCRSLIAVECDVTGVLQDSAFHPFVNGISKGEARVIGADVEDDFVPA